MQEYMYEVNKNKIYKYKLFAVLVHSGLNSNSGHYYSFIRSSNSWIKFNDQFVERA